MSGLPSWPLVEASMECDEIGVRKHRNRWCGSDRRTKRAIIELLLDCNENKTSLTRPRALRILLDPPFCIHVTENADFEHHLFERFEHACHNNCLDLMHAFMEFPETKTAVCIPIARGTLEDSTFVPYAAYAVARAIDGSAIEALKFLSDPMWGICQLDVLESRFHLFHPVHWQDQRVQEVIKTFGTKRSSIWVNQRGVPQKKVLKRLHKKLSTYTGVTCYYYPVIEEL